MGSREALAMKHARAWVESIYGTAPTHEASRSMVRIGDGRTISRRVDLFGVFDLAVITQSGGLILIQVTTWQKHGGSASARRHKVKKWIEEEWLPLDADLQTRMPEIWVIAWEAGRCFHSWQWEYPGWSKGLPLYSPLIKRSTVPLLEPTPEPMDERPF